MSTTNKNFKKHLPFSSDEKAEGTGVKEKSKLLKELVEIEKGGQFQWEVRLIILFNMDVV